jgi:hypothetical protein
MLVKEATLPPKCQYVLEYTADRWWDLAPYLVDARLTLTKNGVMIGSGHYHLNGHGGLDLAKWAGTAAKLDPVIDGMLQNHSSASGVASEPAPESGNAQPDMAGEAQKEDIYSQLTKLADLRKRGIITDAEFDAQKKKILEAAK